MPGYPGYRVTVRYATEHRCGVAVSGPGLSDAVGDTDPLKDNLPLRKSEPTDDSPEVCTCVYVCMEKPARRAGPAGSVGKVAGTWQRSRGDLVGQPANGVVSTSRVVSTCGVQSDSMSLPLLRFNVSAAPPIPRRRPSRQAW